MEKQEVCRDKKSDEGRIWTWVPVDDEKPWLRWLFIAGRTFASSQRVSRSEIQVSKDWLVNEEVGTHLERTEQALINTHHGTCIIKLSTIIGRREKSD